jgi:hypothetical protein
MEKKVFKNFLDKKILLYEKNNGKILDFVFFSSQFFFPLFFFIVKFFYQGNF